MRIVRQARGEFAIVGSSLDLRRLLIEARDRNVRRLGSLAEEGWTKEFSTVMTLARRLDNLLEDVEWSKGE